MVPTATPQASKLCPTHCPKLLAQLSFRWPFRGFSDKLNKQWTLQKVTFSPAATCWVSALYRDLCGPFQVSWRQCVIRSYCFQVLPICLVVYVVRPSVRRHGHFRGEVGHFFLCWPLTPFLIPLLLFSCPPGFIFRISQNSLWFICTIFECIALYGFLRGLYRCYDTPAWLAVCWHHTIPRSGKGRHLVSTQVLISLPSPPKYNSPQYFLYAH